MVNLKNLLVKFLCVLYVCVEVTYTVYFLQLFALFLRSLTVLDLCDFFFPPFSAENLCFNFTWLIYVLVSNMGHEGIKYIQNTKCRLSTHFAQNIEIQ